MNINRNISVTGPVGTWTYQQLIGAKVRIASSPSKRLFMFDSDEKHIIEDIKFRLTSSGLSISQVYLEGISYPFEWKDLEIVGLDMVLYGNAICGTFCCGGSLCGYGSESTDNEISKKEDNVCCHVYLTDGPILD